MIRSNNEAVRAVADLWEGMVQVIKQYRAEGRGFLYHSETDNNFMSYMNLEELENGIGKEYLGIDDDLHHSLIELVKSGYDFETEFVFVTRKQEEGVTRFIANKGSLKEDGWQEYNSPDHIKQVEQDRQKYAARMMAAHLKQQRMGKKGKSKGSKKENGEVTNPLNLLRRW